MDRNNNDILLRINELMNFYSLNKSQFSNKIGIHQSNLTKLFNGERKIGEGTINKIVLSFDINKEWLLTGEGNMLKEDNKVNDNIVSVPVENADNDSFADYLKKQVAEKDKKIEEKDDEIKELYKKIERLNSYIAKLEVLLDVNSVDYQNIKRAV